MEGLQVILQAVCFVSAKQLCMHQRMELKDSSEPALIGMRCSAPSVGHGVREASRCQIIQNIDVALLC